MWGVMKAKVLKAQEDILGYKPDEAAVRVPSRLRPCQAPSRLRSFKRSQRLLLALPRFVWRRALADIEVLTNLSRIPQLEGKLTRDDKNKGNATVMKMWRDISDTVSPAAVALVCTVKGFDG